MLWYVYATETNLVVKPDLVDRGRASPMRGGAQGAPEASPSLDGFSIKLLGP